MSRSRLFATVTVTIAAIVAVDWLVKHGLVANSDLEYLTNDKDPAMWVLPAFTLLASLLLFIVPRRLTAVVVGLLGGGLFANLIDRALFGPVLDYIPAPAGYWINLADFSIFSGLAIGTVLLFYVLRDGIVGRQATA